MKNKKSAFVESFRKATQEHTRKSCGWDWIANQYVESPYPYPIPGGKYTIDERFGKKEICIRCRKVWTDDLMTVAKKVAGQFGAKVSSALSVGGFGTAYNFFTIVFK